MNACNMKCSVEAKLEAVLKHKVYFGEMVVRTTRRHEYLLSVICERRRNGDALALPHV
jgi:hypothetical protein